MIPKSTLWGACLVCLLSVAGCAPDMSDQPKYTRLRPSDFFFDGRSGRPKVVGTVARGTVDADEAFSTGRVNGAPVAKIPVPITPALLERGRERFSIYCSPCHGYLGGGEGMVVLRGFQHPPSYHIDRLREAPDGHFFDVITHGLGAMSSYATLVAPPDRWAITAYIRALQLSQNAKVDLIPPAERQKLMRPAR